MSCPGRNATYAPMSDSYGAISESFIPPGWSVALILGLLGLATALLIWRWLHQRRRFGAAAAPLGRLIRPIAWAAIGAAIMLYVALGFRGIPMAVVVALAVAAILAFVATGTVFGRQMYAIGGNREAAHLSGINIKRNLFLSFVIMGAVCAVAGVLTTARLNAIAPSVGQFLELDAIAAAVIGDGICMPAGRHRKKPNQSFDNGRFSSNCLTQQPRILITPICSSPLIVSPSRTQVFTPNSFGIGS